MKKAIIRFVTLAAIVLVTLAVSTIASAAIVNVEPEIAISFHYDQSFEWPYLEISRPLDTIESVVIFFHGSGHAREENPTLENMIERLGAGGGPVRYALDNELPLPAGFAVICPQSYLEGEFSSEPEKLHRFITKITQLYGTRNIAVVGHSDGAIAVSKVVGLYQDDARCWGIFSGRYVLGTFPSEVKIFLTATLSEMGEKRVGYESVWDYQPSFSKNLTRNQQEAWIDPVTNSAYAMHGWECSHGQTTQIMKEEIFWQWLENIFNEGE